MVPFFGPPCISIGNNQLFNKLQTISITNSRVYFAICASIIWVCV